MLRSAISLLLIVLLFGSGSICLAQEKAGEGAPAETPAGQEAADEAKAPAIDSGLIGALSFRSIGPALMSGRIADLAVDPEKPNTWYVAAGSGGVWKTTNAGTTWTPIFDRYASYSIGCVTLDPSDPHTVWVGTGENVGGRHVGIGDGIYVSHDGGNSFTNKGLAGTEHISRILVHPTDSKIVFVAAQGPLWSSGGERGVYKSTDGGTTWRLVLGKGPWTGATDLVMDPENPDLLYAALHQRHRTVAALINTGPESGIHKSTDGGETWTELTSGLPGEAKGKIGLAISPQQSNVVYATIELAGRTGGFYRSANHGASWQKQSDYLSGGTGPHYYQEIYADPHRFDCLYHANVMLGRTVDGGKTFVSVESASKHVDNHAVAFHPHDPDFLLVGCDGGLYQSHDFAATFQFAANLPLTQFYKVDVDYDFPVYHVVGGTQDNNSQYGPARTLSTNGIRNADWRITIGGDGHDCAIDPEDPNVIYCESQQGFLRRFDRRTGESVDIRPQPEKGEENLRFNWDAPILISPHSHTRLYFGSRKLHRSDDRGDNWTAISGDLSRGQDRLRLPLMGHVWSIDAGWDLMAMSAYGNITSVSESPLVEGLIYVGTDDGLIQITEDGGASWRKVDQLFGVPEYFFVNDIKADRFNADTVYVCVDHHKTGDYKPYVLKSTDRGRTWKSIAGDLPDRHLVWRINQDHVKPELLFLGTEYGAFASINDGEKWIKLGGLPTIPVRDIEIQRRENDVVAATFGRGFYVLDNYAPLRDLNEENLKKDLHFFPVKNAWLYNPDDRLGGLRGFKGDSYFVADNPPYGAVFTYHLRESLKTKKEARHEREGKSADDDDTYPGWDEIRQEDREDAPAVLLEITDAAGNLIDRIQGARTAGLHRTVWDLNHAPFGGTQGSAAVPVVPGTYTVTAWKRIGDQTTQLGEPVTFVVETILEPGLPGATRDEILAFQKQASDLQQAIVPLQTTIEECLTEIAEIKSLITDGRTAPLPLLDQARAVELKFLDARDKLNGDPTRGQRSENDSPSINGRLFSALFGTLGHSYGPTGTHRKMLQVASEEFAAVEAELRAVIESDYEALKKALDDAGVPWTPGRKIPPSGRIPGG